MFCDYIFFLRSVLLFSFVVQLEASTKFLILVLINAIKLGTEIHVQVSNYVVCIYIQHCIMFTLSKDNYMVIVKFCL